jgi:hypothetical protein
MYNESVDLERNPEQAGHQRGKTLKAFSRGAWVAWAGFLLLLVLAACNKVDPNLSVTFFVPGDYGSLTEAVAAAKKLKQPVEIHLQEGIYSHSRTGELFPLTLPSRFKIVGMGDADEIIVDAEGVAPVFVMERVEGVRLRGFSITDSSSAWVNSNPPSTPSIDSGKGGALYISSSGFEGINLIIYQVSAKQMGSAIFIGDGGTVTLRNNLIFKTGTKSLEGSAQPFAVDIQDSSPVLLNNTLVHDTFGGVRIQGHASPVIRNTLLAFHGQNNMLGQGLLNLSTGSVTCAFNLFFENSYADYATSSAVFTAVDLNRFSNMEANISGNPRFSGDKASRATDFVMDTRSAGYKKGDADAQYLNVDGTRNSIGHQGGPSALEF